MSNTLFSDASKMWLENRKNKVRTTTYQRYRLIVENHLNKAIGTERIEALSRERISQYLSELQKSLKYNTSHAILIVLRSIMRESRDEKEEQNILENLHIKKNRSHINCLTSVQTRKLNRYLSQQNTLESLGILIALNMGLRIGEICALKWENINLVKKCLYVKGTMQRIKSEEGYKKTKVEILPPKTENSEREVPIPDIIVRILNQHQEADDCFLLTGKNDSFVEPRLLESHFKKICTKVLGVDIKFHDLRHTFATQAISHDADVKTVSEILGHSDINTTLSFYRNVSFEDKAKTINKLGKLLI